MRMGQRWRAAACPAVAALLVAGCGGGGANAAGGTTTTSPPTSPALAVTTAALPGAAIGQSYGAALAAANGSMPYSWVIASGKLPAGVTMTSGGALGGMPQNAGTYEFTAAVKDAQGQTAQAALGITVAAPAAPPGPAPAVLDAYGGVQGKSAPGGAAGYFSVTKVGNRWVFADPLGNVYWMLGVFDVDAPGSVDGLPGTSYAARIAVKYGDMAQWGIQAAQRLKSWGFNAAAEYSSAYVGAVDQYAVRNTTAPIPSVGLIRPSYDSLIDSGSYAPGPVKELVNGLDGNYKNYRGDIVADIYDPNFALYVNGLVAAMSPPAVANSPWIVGNAVGDLDDLWGFGPGPDQPTSPAGQASSNIGWIALCTNFEQHSNLAYNTTYADTSVYTKYAMQAYLELKYNNIAALDAAWGADYTTFGDAGGFGAGTGLLDEDGRDPWVGHDDVAMTTAAPALRADLNAFMALYVQRYFQLTSAALRQYQPHHLVFGPATLNGWAGISRQAVLQAAGQYVDVVQANAANQTIYDQTLQWTGDKPLVAWVGFTANPDSDLFAFAHLGDVGTQPLRAAEYSGTLDQLYGFTGSPAAGSLAGSQNFVGMKFWAWSDSWGEKANWGLVSVLDNAYDGHEDTVAAGMDPWGYPTGGEPRNSGDFITYATQENQKIVAQLAGNP